jgi:hypothetical protein
MTVDELIERSHAMAVLKGWWPEGEQRSVVDQVNNFSAEISEAWEEYRAGRVETWYSDQYDGDSISPLSKKPEGFWVEVADLLIRLTDTMGAYGWTYSELRKCDYKQLDSCNWNLPRLIATLHICVGCLGIDPDGHIGGGWETGAQRSASGTICLCLLAAQSHGVDLLALCELKMAYNATRSHRHGGKLA